MITYNTTFMMHPTTEGEFITFMREVYVPGILAEGVLHSPRLKRIEQHSDEDDALSFALSFEAESAEVLGEYLSTSAHRMPTLLVSQFGERVVGFTTLMHEVAL